MVITMLSLYEYEVFKKIYIEVANKRHGRT